ncbi:MAG: hypothetical protein A2039_09420 [Candidatus Melainabacteria bacterium GWA2_34_9]|nr:MAG: hypothetical protein A2039_09420 [Candidatus Melainabacteria bacterium GWA2_34_9]
MFKQIYRFLSILIASNLLFSHTAFGKQQKTSVEKKPSSVKSKSGEYTTLYGVQSTEDIYNSYQNSAIKKLEKLEELEASKPQKPVENDQKPYVTKYGVFFPDDIEDTYPPKPVVKPEPVKPPCDNKPVAKPKPVTQKPDENTYVTKYGVYFPDDIFDTYSQQQNDCPPDKKSN